MKFLSVGSLFSGIGGIELGLERTGYFKTKWFVENDRFCQRVLAKHWSGIPIYGDITEIDFSKLPKVDMLAGGFPCQDISIAGKGKGIKKETRSGLWSYFAKSIRILRPRYALIENVPALAYRGLNIVLADLAEAGYDAEWFDIQASDFGALHKRERIFIVAYNRYESAIQSWRDGKIRKAGKDALGKTPEYPASNANRDGFDGEGLSVFQRRPRQDSPSDKNGIAADFDSIARNGIYEGQPDPERRIVADDYLIQLSHFIAKKNQSKEGFSWCQNIRKIEDLRGRPTIPKPLFRGGRDGIPDWVDRIKTLGNAVVPDCAEFIGELIMAFDRSFNGA